MKKAHVAIIFFIGLVVSCFSIHLLLRLFFKVSLIDSIIATGIVYVFILAINYVLEKREHG